MIGFIIFGTRGVTYNHTKGQFYCPCCDVEKSYKHKRVRRFFTLYFIPVIPLDLLGEYIECARCNATFKEDVLDFDPSENTQVEAEFQLAVKRVMVLMMMADGVIDDAEVTTIGELYSRITGKPFSEEQVRAEIAVAEAAQKTATDYLSEVAPYVNDAGKDLIIKAGIFVAAADGEFQDEEKELLFEMAKALEVSPDRLTGLLDATLGD